jgi:chemotaxis protein MotB
MAALRETLSKISAALEASEKLAAEKKIQIVSLGKRLNAALASKVHQLGRYRSEFFGRLRDLLGGQKGVRIVGDRFVFQSEVLFAKAKAELGNAEIPADIDWVLRVDGHTDRDPIKTARFPSNWELSSARALSVVRFLIEQGLPPNRFAAAGFGEFQPLDGGADEIAKRRNRRIELKLTQR